MPTLARPDELTRLAPAWEALAAEAGTLPTQDAPWARAAAEAYGGRIRVVVAGDPAAPAAIAPLVRRGAGFDLLGVRELFEPMDLLARSGEAHEALVRELVAARLPLLLKRVPAGSRTVTSLQRAIGRRGAVVVREAVGHPSIALGEAWQEPGGGLSSRRRSDLRRARRRAEKLGEVTFELLRPAREDVPALLDAAYAIEERSWKGRAGTALARDEAQARFFRLYAAEVADRGTLRVDIMRIGDAAVAMQIGLEWRGRRWLYKIGYDDAFAACSPGLLLLGESVADAARRGLRTFELLGSSAAWTDAWTRDVHPCVSVLAFPADVGGAVALSAEAARVARTRSRAFGHTRSRAAIRAGVAVAARRYVSGPALDDALRVHERYEESGLATTIGYWNDEDEPAAGVLRQNTAVLEALVARGRGGEVSVKPPAAGNDRAAIAELLRRAREAGVGVHFDSLGPETAGPVLELAAGLAADAAGGLGCTLPARWRRSVADAELAVRHGLRVRVVKGEWADPEEPRRNARAGLLEIVDALAGRVPFVGVGSHDPVVVADALARLQSAGTPCELQVLYGTRADAAVAAARAAGVAIRVYVPFGHSRLPYPLSDVRRSARLARRLATDVLVSARGPDGPLP
jgi:CelD/BcsL family acetyltransferase involved in cellulose biosynthesis